MKKNKENAQIMIYAYLYKSNKKKHKYELELCKLLNMKLEQLGYKVRHFNPNYKGSYFLTIFKKDYICSWNTSITPACCMASSKRRPISIEWFVKHFNWIMDNKLDSKSWTLLEQLSYECYD